MKLLLLLIFIVYPTFLEAQTLNRFGHIINNIKPKTIEYRHLNNEDLCLIDGLALKGNAVFDISNGYLTLSGCYENTESYVRIYNKQGDQIFTKKFNQTINFVLSQNKMFGAFYDGNNIQILNLINFKTKEFSPSTIFNIANNGELCFYDKVKSTITYSTNTLPFDEPIYDILIKNNTPYIITKHNIYIIANGNLRTIFNVDNKRIFEVKFFVDALYISTKEEVKNKFVFRLLISGDLKTFEKVSERTLNLITPTKINVTQKHNNALQIDLIRNPLNFDKDSVYQPIGNSYAEIQEYSTNATYTHPGVDLLGYNQQPVSSVKKGYVKALLTTSAQYHWRMAIADNNVSTQSSGYLYAHLDNNTIPYAVGDSVLMGDTIGLLVNFPVSGFVHCHFAKIYCTGNQWSGNWWTYENPLKLISTLIDTTAPVFQKTINNDAFAFKSITNTYLNPSNLSGKVKVISKFYDRVNSNWKVDVDKIGYSISPLSSPSTILTNTLSFEYNFPTDVYHVSTYSSLLLNTLYARDNNCFSTGNYNTRDFYHQVSSSNGNDTINGLDTLQYFNTQNYTNGMYIFRVYAYDASENFAKDSMIIGINNTTVGIIENIENNNIQILPNPNNGNFIILNNELENYHIKICDVAGRQIFNEELQVNGKLQFSSNLNNGMYLCELTNSENPQKRFYKRIVVLK